MNEALSKQEALLNMVSRALENFKKVGRLNYSAAKIHSRISSLKEIWSQCIQGHAALMQIYPEAKRANLAYFQEDQLDEHEEIYQMTLDFMTEWLEELEPFGKKVESAIAVSAGGKVPDMSVVEMSGENSESGKPPAESSSAGPPPGKTFLVHDFS